MPQKTLKIALGVTYKEGAEVDDETILMHAAGMVRHMKQTDGVESVHMILNEVDEVKTKAEQEQATRDRDELIAKVLERRLGR